MELVPHATEDEGRPSSQTTGRLASRRQRLHARLSSGQAVEAKDVMSILVAASYTEHPDEFWTRSKLILDSVETTHAPGYHTSGSTQGYHKSGWGQDNDALMGSLGASARSGRAGTAAGRQTCQGLSADTPPLGWGTSQKRDAAASRSSRAEGDALFGDSYYYSTQTVSSRYSASAIAAASKILLQT
jgi:hypothetical protein